MNNHNRSRPAAGVVALALTALFLTPLAASAVVPESWLTENQELDARYLQAISAGDLDAIMQCWSTSPEARVITFGTIYKGTEQIRQNYINTFIPGTESHAEGLTIEYWRVGDMVFAAGSVTVVVTPVGGGDPIIAFLDVWTDVRRKENGKWVYALDHATMIPLE